MSTTTIQPNEASHEMICLGGWDYLSNQQQSTYYDGKIEFAGVTKRDAINITVWGKVLQDGIWYAFICEDGDNNGTDIVAWQPFEQGALVPEPEQPNPMRLVVPPHKFTGLNAQQADLLARKFKAMQSQPWFIGLQQGYNYDLYVQPGCVTNDHYRKNARQRGLEWSRLLAIDPEVREKLGIGL